MSEGQIASWRKWTYENLDLQKMFKIKELLNFPDIFPKDTTISEIQDAILQQLKEDIVLGNISYEDIVFVMFDSSVMCSFKIEDMLTAAKEKNKLDDVKFVIIDTHIGQAENGYKMLHKERYPCVDFNILEDNLNILSFREYTTENHDVKHSIIKTDFLLDNNILTKFEDALLKINDWKPGCRNDINDNVQLQILQDFINHIPHSHGLLISNDKKLLKKAENVFYSGINLHSMKM